MAKLTEHQVAEIRRRYAAGDVSFNMLARLFGISPQHVSLIVNRRRWKNAR